MREERVKLVGVDCPSCIPPIQRELERLGASLEADVVSDEAFVRYDEGRASLRDVVRAIRDAGYDVEKRSLVLTVELGEDAPRLEGEVSKLRGVIECRYSPATGLAKIVYNPRSILEEELLKSVRGLGLKAELASSEEVVVRGERAWAALASFLIGLTAVAYHTAESFTLAPPVGAALYASLATAVLLLNVELIARGLRALARLSPTMESLIALSSATLYAYSLTALLGNGGHATFFEATAGVLGFVSAGTYLEGRLRRRAFQALGELAELQRGRVRVLREGAALEVEVSEVKVGDLVEVRAGERLSVDGVVVEGWGYVDESTFTGEPVPRFKTAERRSPVLAGSVLVSGFLRVAATRVGRDTSIAYIVETVREAQFRKPRFQRVADRIVGCMTWAVIATSALTLTYWALAGESLDKAAAFAAAVLAVACPCPLGIAIPLVVAVASIKAAKLGILIRGGDIFERVLRVDTVVFDKTGTLTVGEPRVAAVHAVGALEEGELLALAGSAELRSEHPLAKAVLRKCSELSLVEPSSYEHVPGLGVVATVSGRAVAVGSQRLVEGLGATVSSRTLELAERLRRDGATVVFVAVDGAVEGLLEMRDELRGEAAEVVERLRGKGLRVLLATGDGKGAGEWVVSKLGLDGAYAEMRPEDKADLVDALQRHSSRPLFVGDGVNDAPAMGRAFLGVAMGGGAEVSRAAGDVVLMNSKLESLLHLRELGGKVRRKALENLAWAFAYNLSLIPLAMGALYRPLGLVLRPELAAAAMVLSDISVVANSLTLLRWSPAATERLQR